MHGLSTNTGVGCVQFCDNAIITLGNLCVNRDEFPVTQAGANGKRPKQESERESQREKERERERDRESGTLKQAQWRGVYSVLFRASMSAPLFTISRQS